jgi:hypothetical protein
MQEKSNKKARKIENNVLFLAIESKDNMNCKVIK